MAKIFTWNPRTWHRWILMQVLQLLLLQRCDEVNLQIFQRGLELFKILQTHILSGEIPPRRKARTVLFCPFHLFQLFLFFLQLILHTLVFQPLLFKKLLLLLLLLACAAAMLRRPSGDVAVEDGVGVGVATGIDFAVLGGDDQSEFRFA